MVAIPPQNPPYIMGVWVGLKLNQHGIIQYSMGYRFGSHKLVLCNVSNNGLSIVLEKGTPTAITNSYYSLLTHPIPAKVDIDDVIRKILAKKYHQGSP